MPIKELSPDRALRACGLLAALLWLGSCGAEPPTFQPAVQRDPGNIIVNSHPGGATIFLDGQDQHTVTPDTLKGLTPGSYRVSVALRDFASDPLEVIIDLKPAQTDSAVFALTSRAGKVVVLEGFANVSCPPCPGLTDNLVAMAAKPDFPGDRVLFMEYAVSWPQLADPFFLANAAENSDRYGQYGVLEAPDLYIDGRRQTDALDGAAMEAAVRAALALDPGFEMEVSADFSGPAVPVTVTLTANRDLDLTGYLLYVAVFEKTIVIDPAPGTNGQTVFHHVFRDRVDAPPALGPLAAGTPREFVLTLGKGGGAASAPGNYAALALVQHGAAFTVLQAGSTVPAGASAERNH